MQNMIMILMTQVHPAQHRAVPFSPISVPPMPRLSRDLNINVNHRTFLVSIYLVVVQVALLMHGAIWLAKGIFDVPWSL